MEENVMTVSQACVILGMDKHNVFKLIKNGVLKDADMRKVAGSAFQRHVTTGSVYSYKGRKLDLDDDIQTFKVRLHISLYKAVCDNNLTKEQLEDLSMIFTAASNETLKGKLYRKLKKEGATTDTEDEFDPHFDVDELALDDDDDFDDEEAEDDDSV